MRSYALAGMLVFSAFAQAQNIYFGAVTKSKKKNEFCSYTASVPQLVAGAQASAGVKNFVKDLNAKSLKALAQADREYEKAVNGTDKNACSAIEYSNQADLEFKIPTNLGATVMSIYSTNSGYTGGAHGGMGIDTLTFNTETGETYANLSAFIDQSKLDQVKDMILKKAKEKDEYLDPQMGWNDWNHNHTNISQIDNFYVSDDGIVVYFQQYEIGSYAEGAIEANFYWYELEQIGLNGSAAAKALLSNKKDF